MQPLKGLLQTLNHQQPLTKPKFYATYPRYDARPLNFCEPVVVSWNFCQLH